MYKGTEASAGIGIGKAVLVRSAEPVIRRELAADADAEVERLRKALADTAVRTEKLASELASRTGEKEAGILQAHLMLLSDPTLIGEIESFIRKEAVCSEYAGKGQQNHGNSDNHASLCIQFGNCILN